MLAGNLSYAFKAHGISWRAAPLGLAVAAFLVAVAIAVLIREPKKGRFIVQKVRKFPLMKPEILSCQNELLWWHHSRGCDGCGEPGHRLGGLLTC